MDTYVTAVVVERLRRPDAVELLLDGHAPDLGDHRERAAALRVRLDDLATALADGLLPLPAVREQSDRLRRQIAETETQMHDLDRATVLADLAGAADVEAVWERLDLDRRRAVIDCLMGVHLLAPGRGRRAFDPATVRIEWRG